MEGGKEGDGDFAMKGGGGLFRFWKCHSTPFFHLSRDITNTTYLSTTYNKLSRKRLNRSGRSVRQLTLSIHTRSILMIYHV